MIELSVPYGITTTKSNRIKIWGLPSLLCVLLSALLQPFGMSMLASNLWEAPLMERRFPAAAEHEPYGLLWAELIYDLDRQITHEGPQIAIDPSFALDVDFLSLAMDKSLFANVQVPKPSAILGLSGVQASFKLTAQMLNHLKDQGIPSNILENLKFLETQEFTTAAAFLNAVEQYIGKAQTVRYKEAIWQQIAAEWPISSVKLANVSGGTDSWDMTAASKNNKWENFFDYSWKFKRKIFSSDGRKTSNRSSVPSDEKDDFFFNIEEFFKKWGISKPLYTVLGLIAIYFILVFLAKGH